MMKMYKFSKEKYLSIPSNKGIYEACLRLKQNVDDLDGNLVELNGHGIGRIGMTYIHIDWCNEVQEPVDFMTAINSGRKIKYETFFKYYTLEELIILWGKMPASLVRAEIQGQWLIEC